MNCDKCGVELTEANNCCDGGTCCKECCDCNCDEEKNETTESCHDCGCSCDQ